MKKGPIPNKRYLATLFIISCLLLSIFVAVLYRQAQVNELTTEEVVQRYESLRKARRINTLVLGLETGQRGYLLTGASKFLEPYNQALENLDIELHTLSLYVADTPAQKAKVTEVTAKVTALQKLLAVQIEKFRGSGIRGLSQGDLEQGRRLMNEIRAHLDDLVNYELDLLQEQSSSSLEQQSEYETTLVVGAALALGGLALANGLVISLIARNRRATESLHESEERLLLFLNGIDDGVFDYNVAERSIYYSPSYKKMLGYNETEHPNTLGMLDALMHEDDREQSWSAFQSMVTPESNTYHAIFRLKHRDGHWVWILARGVSVWDKNGALMRIIGTHTDITEQKAREEELKQLNTDLEGFVYIASHDLRAPLVNLKGFAGEIQHALNQANPIISRITATLKPNEAEIIGQAFTQDIPEALGFIGSAVEKMDNLTTSILKLSHIGQREYHTEQVDTNAIVKRSIGALQYEISTQNIDVTVEDLPPVITDPLALEQVFGNILDNAVKYLEPGRPGTIEIRAVFLPPEVIFSIRDNGRGIAVGDQQKVFDIFRRAGNSIGVRGAGVGMAYVKATIKKLGGRIWFSSVLGEGTTFYFSVPLRAQ